MADTQSVLIRYCTTILTSMTLIMRAMPFAKADHMTQLLQMYIHTSVMGAYIHYGSINTKLQILTAQSHTKLQTLTAQSHTCRRMQPVLAELGR